MSSSISADYSPTSNYSYPTDLSLSPPTPPRQSRSYHDQTVPPPPRLSSPHIFRDIFVAEAAGPSTRTPQLPPLHEINFAETMQDVNRALQSANRALQTAQEAFQSRRTPIGNMARRRDVVDLTGSPSSPPGDDRYLDSFLTATLHPHDSRLNTRMANSSLNEPFYPQAQSNSQSMFVEEDDPTSTYAGQSDSLAGVRRRYEAQYSNPRRSFMSIPNVERHLARSGLPNARRQEEEEAIRRQRIAREQWEHTQQRQRLQQQRDRIMAADQRNNRNNQQSQGMQTNSSNHSTGTSLSGVALNPGSSPPRPSSRSSTSTSSVESVDLTTVNNATDLTAALIQSQASNSMANPAGSSGEPRSALTGYKCPICLEPPRNATTTICGHLFCHECILETLKNSENIRREDAPTHRKVRGQCPVCRKELARKEEEGQNRTLVPLEIKLISKKRLEELRRLERKRQRKLEKDTRGKGKGKEKEAVPAARDKEIFELSSDDEDNWGVSGSSQKENKAKRIKLSASEELDEELFGAFTNDEQI